MKKFKIYLFIFCFIYGSSFAQDDKFPTIEKDLHVLDSFVIDFPHFSKAFDNVEKLIQEGVEKYDKSIRSNDNRNLLIVKLGNLKFINFAKKRKYKKRINELEIETKEEILISFSYHDTAYFLLDDLFLSEIDKFEIFNAENKKEIEKLKNSADKNFSRGKKRIEKYLEFIKISNGIALIDKENWSSQKKKSFDRLNYKRLLNDFDAFKKSYVTSLNKEILAIKICLEDEKKHEEELLDIKLQAEMQNSSEEEEEEIDINKSEDESEKYSLEEDNTTDEEKYNVKYSTSDEKKSYLSTYSFITECDDGKENINGITYRVQIVALSNPISKENQQKLYAKCLVRDRESKDNLFKYSVGEFYTYKKAKEFKKKQVLMNGVKDAFIVAFNRSGEQIHEIKEAISITD
ncbi:MAG: hypothetical protein B6I24_07005 [Bacteroidetes bacterium 4572_128]|nr:MAG: hypothetical protein B6I24_07005 [Bacteroidetes bacterium 4572_128]